MISTEVVLWIILAVAGIVICGYMLLNSFQDRAIAETTEERTVTWGDTIQWTLGLVGKVIVLLIGVLVIMIPGAEERPEGAWQAWAVNHRSAIFSTSLILVVFSLDLRDLVLVALKHRLQYLARHAGAEEDEALAAASIQQDAAETQLEAANVQQEVAKEQRRVAEEQTSVAIEQQHVADRQAES